jgi:SnoaL-like domain
MSVSLSDAERAQICADIKKRNQDLLAAWAGQNPWSDWIKLYADESNPSWAEGRNLLTLNTDYKIGSVAELETAFRDLVEARDSTDVSMTNEHVSVLSPTDGIHVGEFTVTWTEKGQTSEKHVGMATTHWTLENGEWKILHYHQSVAPAAKS